ncbi:TetR/AcrR family transcriptional regulator [Streptomyces hiroshimensis]|uniref:TetR/AcrR family transcriptional regulator n=1 Tax=Streptomyces hiroshimensis TaxID=66424 RepID=UPI00167B57FD|nr:TetR/AcrR family transcriptional regulator [Streptomyces hiroshimensis]
MDRVSRQSRVAKLPPRERILDAAEELFSREGIKAVGVQAIASRADTTKMALYRHFATKDALVEEWLRIVAADYTAVFDRLEEAHPDEPRAQILGIARFIADGLPEISHRGCPFINSIAELPDRTHPARRLIEAHKANQMRQLTDLCARAGLSDPDEAATEITFVLEGAQVSTQNGSVEHAGERLMRIVEAVLDRHSAPKAAR